MFKRGTTLILTAMIIAQASMAWAQVSQSQTFRLSVTIPAVVGINISENTSSTTSLAQNALTQPVMEQRVVRNNKPVILRSIVML